MKLTISKQDILKRLKIASKTTSDADLARFLGVSPATLSNWKARGSIDYDLVFSMCEDINLDWLLTGQGAMMRDERSCPTVTPTVIYKGDPKDAAIIAAKDEVIAAKDIAISTLCERIKDLETKLHDQSVGLRTAPSADTPSVGGIHASRK